MKARVFRDFVAADLAVGTSTSRPGCLIFLLRTAAIVEEATQGSLQGSFSPFIRREYISSFQSCSLPCQHVIGNDPPDLLCRENA